MVGLNYIKTRQHFASVWGSLLFISLHDMMISTSLMCVGVSMCFVAILRRDLPTATLHQRMAGLRWLRLIQREKTERTFFIQTLDQWANISQDRAMLDFGKWSWYWAGCVWRIFCRVDVANNGDKGSDTNMLYRYLILHRYVLAVILRWRLPHLDPKNGWLKWKTWQNLWYPL